MDNNIIIRQKNGKQFLLFIGAIVMTSVSAFLWFLGSIMDPTEDAFLRALFLLFWAFGTVFFGICLIFISYRLICSKPLLTLTEKGFIDTSSLTAAGFVNWTNVSGMKIVEIAGIKLVSIAFYDPDKFLSELSPVKRWIAKVNLATGAGALCLNLVSAERKEEEVLEMMKAYHRTFQTQDPSVETLDPLPKT